MRCISQIGIIAACLLFSCAGKTLHVVRVPASQTECAELFSERFTREGFTELPAQSGARFAVEISPRAQVDAQQVNAFLDQLNKVIEGGSEVTYHSLGIAKDYRTLGLLSILREQLRGKSVTFFIVPGGLSECMYVEKSGIILGSRTFSRTDTLAIAMHELSHTFQDLPKSMFNEIRFLSEVDANLFGNARSIEHAISMTIEQYPLLPFRGYTVQQLRDLYFRFQFHAHFPALRELF